MTEGTLTRPLQGKRALIMGVANDRSIAWGIAQAMHGAGAELAFTYQGEAFGKRVQPLAQALGSDVLLDADVTDAASLDRLFAALEARWGRLDILVHAIAYSDKDELTGRFINTTRDNFRRSLDISCYSLIDLARRARPMMAAGGTLLTLTYQGSTRVTPNYNVMGVAKAALEASVRYSRERDFAGADEDAGRGRDRGRAGDVPACRGECAAAVQSDARGGGGHGGLARLGCGRLYDGRYRAGGRRVPRAGHAAGGEPLRPVRRRPVVRVHACAVGVIRPMAAPVGSWRMAMRPVPGTSQGSRRTLPPAARVALQAASTSSTAK